MSRRQGGSVARAWSGELLRAAFRVDHLPPARAAERTDIVRSSLARRLARGVERGLAGIGLVLLIYHSGFDLSVVISDSMSPTLQGTSVTNGDWVLTERLSYWFRAPRRWDVATLRNGEGAQIMKRVVGLPGETIAMHRQDLYINDQPLVRPSSLAGLNYLGYGNLAESQRVDCGDGYFLLGDHSVDSQDSRFEGPFAPDRLLGRAWWIVWPPARFGCVGP